MVRDEVAKLASSFAERVSTLESVIIQRVTEQLRQRPALVSACGPTFVPAVPQSRPANGATSTPACGVPVDELRPPAPCEDAAATMGDYARCGLASEAAVEALFLASAGGQRSPSPLSSVVESEELS